ncbi:MAG: hypothetical protein IJ183_00050, partial [Prevotella sp.]|nr:hypothetical protein [Prevotella sp.]
MKKLFTLLTLFLSISSGAWAIEQDTDGYYLIGSVQDWQNFAALVETTPTANAKMTADVDLGDDQTAIGAGSVPYQGSFDGQGHTLTVNYDKYVDSWAIAPFGQVKNASIQNLHVAGRIIQRKCGAGGVAGRIMGNLTIKKCWVSAYMYVYGSGDAQGTIGGIASYCDETGVNNSSVLIEDCIFSGQIATGIHSGSIMSHVNGYNGNSAIIRNCLAMGTYVSSSGSTGTFIRVGVQGSPYTLDNCYYRTSFGAVQGTYASDADFSDGTTATNLQNGRDEEVWVQDIFTNQPMLKVFASLWQDGEETYCIGSDAGWTAFANGINDGTIAISANAKLMADNITVTAMIGNSGHRYAGTFDGNNKTITLSISGTSGFEAPFSYINGATIKDLKVSGTLSGGIHCSGLIGLTNGTNNVNNVIVDCAITATGSHCSGLLGRNDGATTTLNGCAFTGSISKASGNCNVGVLWGWSNGGTAILTNCLENGTYTNCSPLQPIGNLPTNTITNTFYVSNVSSSYGTRVYTSTQDGEVNGLVTAVDGNNYYALTDISGINERYELLGASVSPEPVVKFVGTTLTKDADYTVSYSNNTSRGTGSVIITGAGSYSGTKTINFAVAATNLSGSGTEGSPFTIGSDDDWTEFAASVNSGFTFSGMYVKMTDNVNASSMAGQYDSEPFSGTFDGDSKTLNLSIVNTGTSGSLTDPSTGTAPFHYIKNAVIKNVKTTGSVSATAIHASGLVGLADGTNTILGCTVSATINTTSNYVGGVLAHGIASNTTIQDCTFNGTINGSSGGSSYVAGLYGWSHGGSSVVKNSLENGTYTNVRTFNPVFLGWQGGASVSGTYYLNGNGDYGTRVYTALPDGEMCGQVTAADGNNYYALTTVSGINERYQLLDESVTPVPVVKFFNTTLTQNTDYTVSYSDNTSGGTGSVIITGINDYMGTKTVNFKIAANTLTGSGTEGDPYVISSNDDWTSFANSVNSGFTYSGEFVKLTKNVNATVNVGLRNNEPFSGTFDGDGHTLTVTLTANAASTSGNTEGIAPFHFIRNATIKNLRTAGTITSTTNHTSGLVGFSEGTNTFQNCVVSTTLNVKYYMGGFIGHSQSSSITIRDCLFNGTVNGSSSTYIAGIWGWNGGGSGSIVNCLENGTYTGVSSYDAIGWTPATPTNTYRINSSSKGTATTAEALADGTTTAALQNGRAETIWAQDEFTNSPMPAVFANTMIYKVPSSSIGTFSTSVPVVLPEGLEAYVCKTYDSGKSTISTQKVEGTIPANTGVLMKGIGGETYTLVASSQTPEAIEGNALIAVVEATHVDQTNGEYTNFMMKGGKFIKIAASSNPDEKMPANRAYLQLPTASIANSLNIEIDWKEETGIRLTPNPSLLSEGN